MTEYQNTLSAAIADFIQQRASLKLETLDKTQAKELTKLQEGSAEWGELKQTQLEKRQQEVDKFKPENWLASAAGRAKQISLTTHSPKYTHSDAKGNGVLVTTGQGEDSPYVTTESLHQTELDVIGNAAALDIAGLLKLTSDDSSLHQALTVDDFSPFLPFAGSEQQAKDWLEGFKQALTPNDIASHALAKQLYFPVEDDYHLISPLFASSLYQQMHEAFDNSMFSEEQKAAREARKNQEYSENLVVSFPEVATQKFGGSNQQNVSQLNSKRNGKVYLLNCAPPQWQSQLVLPIQSKNAFWQIYADHSWRTVRFLQDYLVKKLNQPSVKAVRDFRGDLIDELIDLLMTTAAEIQNAKNKAGWSIDAKIPDSEKYWLDPYRGVNSEEEDDTAFQAARAENDWQMDIARRFGEWLNRRLRLGDKLNVGDGEYNEWRRLVNKKLNRLKIDLEDFA